MNVGGYQIIDLENKEFIGDGTNTYVYEGIYEKIENTRKPILMTGLNINGAERHNFFTVPRVQGSQFIFATPNFGGNYFEIFVNDNDTVSSHYLSE